MTATTYARVAATLFGLVALMHVARLALGLPVTFGGATIPMAASILGAVVTGSLCVLGFRARG